MKRSSGKIIRRVLMACTFTMVTGCVVVGGGVEYEMDAFRGHHTEKVDRLQFAQPVLHLVIQNVSALSEDGRSMRSNVDIDIRNGRIWQVRPHDQRPKPPADQVIDGTGKFVIPALMDGHVHIAKRDNDLLLYFANGVTHVRDMAGSAYTLRQREETERGAVGPEMYVATQKIYGDSGLRGMFTSWTRGRINISDPADVDSRVQQLADDGFDALKISGFGPDDVHWALLTAGQTYGLDIIGHLDISLDLEGLWRGGQRELAHVEELVKAFDREFGGYTSDTSAEFLEYVQSRVGSTAERLKEHDIAITSTIWLMESLPRQKFDLEAALKTVELTYADPGHVKGTILTQGWLPGHNSYQLPESIANDPDKRRRARVWWEAFVDAIHIVTRGLAQSGVTLMAGTDTGTPIVVAGFSLHDELQSLQAAGIAPADVLATATRVPARWLGLNRGRVAVGEDADLLVLHANPLEDVGNTRSIDAVIHDGAYFNRELLDAMLADVARAVERAQ